MYKKQLVVLGVGILAISIFILTAPKYIYIPHRGTLLLSEFPQLANEHEQKISWDWVLQFSLPTILICGFLIYVLRKPINFSKIFKVFTFLLKYIIFILVGWIIIVTIIDYINSKKQGIIEHSVKNFKLNLDLLPEKPKTLLDIANETPAKPKTINLPEQKDFYSEEVGEMGSGLNFRK